MISFLSFLSGVALYSLRINYSRVNSLNIAVNVLGERVCQPHNIIKVNLGVENQCHIWMVGDYYSLELYLKISHPKIWRKNYHIQSVKLKAWLLFNNSLFGDHLPFFWNTWVHACHENVMLLLEMLILLATLSSQYPLTGITLVVFEEMAYFKIDKTLNHSQASQYLAMSQAMTHMFH